ncbi:MAG: saccharopine dehydrogenase NADP-binding domain-containing protein [Deltaproteobacteria bacterium]|nr:saccharopine dehydrogenase NADP-binding domain-containing protein [Deltaproteobacteria bacterium]
MTTVIVLGGCGAVGSNAVKTLVNTDVFSEVVIGDFNVEKAEQMAAELGLKVSARKFDAMNAQSCEDAMAGCDLVLNCVGPFYSTVKTILTAAIKSGINYVDICDDPDVTLEILGMDEDAKKAGITALIGMGASPGITNLLAKLAADDFLDETDTINIFHTHGGEPFEGEGVIGHRFHCMSIDIPMYLDGELRTVRYFEEDGVALRQTFDFPLIGKDIPLYPYPHPEQLTLPRYIKVKNVTNKGSVLPIEYYQLTSEVCRMGLTSKEPIEVKGQGVVPYDFAVSFIKNERERILKKTGFGAQRGAMSIVVQGKKNGEYLEFRIHTYSSSQALGEGTGIPAAAGAIMMQQGQVAGEGVLPPEGCIKPMEFIEVYRPLVEIADSDIGKSGESSILIEQVDAGGNVTNLEF